MNSLRIIDTRTGKHFAAMSHICARGWCAACPGRVPDDYLRDVITEDHWIPFFQEDYAIGWCRGLLFCDRENPVYYYTCGPIRLGPSSRQSEGLVIYREVHRDWGEIISLYTDPTCISQGYGLALVEGVLCRPRADGYLSCYVFVLRENEGARHFYARHGFAWDGTEEHIPFPHDMIYVDLRYVKQL